MGAQLRIVRRRIKSVQSTKKITRAMELIAQLADREGPATRGAVPALRRATHRAMEDLAANTALAVASPACRTRVADQRVGVLALTSDRGLAGAYSANVLKEAEGVNARCGRADSSRCCTWRARRASGTSGSAGADPARLAGLQRGPVYEKAEEIGRTPDRRLRRRADRRALVRLHGLPVGVHAARDAQAVPADRPRGGRRDAAPSSCAPSTCSSPSRSRSSITCCRST